MPFKIAISNEKGGVAKTTTTFSLGAALVELGKKVLLIDLDYQGNLTLANGFQSDTVNYSPSEFLFDKYTSAVTIQHTKINNLDLIPSSNKLLESENILSENNLLNQRMKIFSDNSILDYDFLIFDCPPSNGLITFIALAAVDLLIIPTQAEYFSAYALRDMMNLIRKTRKDTNPLLAYRILITMLDQRNRTQRAIADQLHQTFGIGLFNTIIEIDTKLRESPITGFPITKYRPKSRGSQQYKALALELMEYIKQQNETS